MAVVTVRILLADLVDDTRVGGGLGCLVKGYIPLLSVDNEYRASLHPNSVDRRVMHPPLRCVQPACLAHLLPRRLADKLSLSQSADLV